MLPGSSSSSSPTTFHSNGSLHTLATIHYRDNDSERASLLSHSSAASSSYGTAVPAGPFPNAPSAPSRRRVVLHAGLKMAAIFLVGCLVLGGTLWVALPRLEDVDRDKLRIPRSFDQLKDLNELLKKYRDIYPFQIFVCFVVIYLFLQAFSLPGSMYMSILGGAVWGIARALPLCCACVATGSSLCYLLSAALGPALLTLPSFKTRMDGFAATVARQRANIIPFLIVLRIAPLPPHWVVNMLCPHLGIRLPTFWLATFLGILGVTVIHTTIGAGLDDMASADDFRLVSWRNFFTLAAVVVGALIPVGIRYVFAREAQAAGDIEAAPPPVHLDGADELHAGALAASPAGTKYPPSPLVFAPGEDDEEEMSGDEDDGSDEDIILEAGPALVLKSGESSPAAPVDVAAAKHDGAPSSSSSTPGA